jgi:nicotinamidase-related amidase
MHPSLVDADQAFLLVVDLQEAYRKALHGWDSVIARACLLCRGAQQLSLPVVYTEQHPKGLGRTAPEVLDALGPAPRFEKRSLTALGAPGLLEHLSALGRRQAIVCGIETQACINHTVHDLLGRGFTVQLAADAIGGRRLFEHEQAYAKMLRSGALAGSVEQILLECLRSADHPAFKAVQALLR